ncbi:hypothetical protein ACFPPD_23445 [Cohnella suwonensis]|uniref:Transcriptional regulator n=1 Tax=Cohnella suwonensis TaxID=696072 RepID=A0ABW0M0L4_9BACL
MSFEKAYAILIEEQLRNASGQRLAMLNKNREGTKKLLEVVIWPALQSFEGIVLEHEMVGSNGAKMYIDVYYEPIAIAFESDGFVTHAELITRDRFDFEKTKIRSVALGWMTYYPFSRDQLDKQPDMCRRAFYEIVGQRMSIRGSRFMEELSVYEREVVRYAVRLRRPFKLDDVKYCLGCKYDLAKRVTSQLLDKKLIVSLGSGKNRLHSFEVTPVAKELLLQRS